MNLPRRRFFRDGLTLVGSALMAPVLIAQDRSRGSVHPPEPSGHEFDLPVARDGHTSGPRPAMNASQRDADFRSCLEQLLASAMKLRDQISGSPLSEVLSVQFYRETLAMERLVKRLKSLAKS